MAQVTLGAALAALAAYARAVDDRDLDALAALVTADVVVRRVGGDLVGRGQFVDFYRAVAASGDRDHHAISNIAVLEEGPSSARVSSSFVNHRQHDDRLHVVQGRYEHHLLGTPEGALIQQMRIQVTGVAVLRAEFPSWAGAS